MKKVLKWLVAVVGVCMVVIIAAALIIPRLIDIKSYKPVLEKKVTGITGRSFSIGDDMDLSVFPWIAIKLSDVRFGNPEGYKKQDMVSVKNFKVRLKLVPLLSKKIEVSTFVLDNPVIYLEKQKGGSANWEEILPSDTKKTQMKKEETAASEKGLPIESLQVDNFSITNGRLIYKDQASGVQKEISDFNLALADISFDKPVKVSFSAKLDNKPVSLNGTAGPIGKEPGKGTILFDLNLKALEELAVEIKGSISDPAALGPFDMTIDTATFSPRQLLAAMGQPLPVKTSDPGVLNAVSFKTKISGTPDQVSLTDGQVRLDDSTLRFTARAKAFSKPDLTADVNLDTIDLDRYLPPPSSSKGEKTVPEPASGTKAAKKKTDYTPLRKLVMDTKFTAGKVKVHGALMEKIIIHVKARNGIITVDPLGMNLYQGQVASTLGIDVRNPEPKTRVVMNAADIQVGPLLKDALEKDVIEGTAKADIELTLQGESPERIKQTLTGKGGLVFNDGAIIGIDLAGMVRNVKARLGAAPLPTERPKTDFAELNIPFTAQNGLVNTSGTRMMSPLVRLVATGDINLVKELLDLRLDPKFVATLKGQGDTKERSGLMVPLLVTGSFSSPKIRPDLKGMIGLKENGLDADALKKQILGDPEDPEKTIDPKKAIEETKKNVEDQVKETVKGLLPGLLK